MTLQSFLLFFSRNLVQLKTMQHNDSGAGQKQDLHATGTDDLNRAGTGTEKAPEVTENNTTQAAQPAVYSVFKPTQKYWILFIAAWAGWFSTASSFIYFPAIPFLARDMDVSVQEINLTVTSYLVASGIFPTVTGSFADVYGRRVTLIVSLLVYTLVNISLALQRSFPALCVLRMFQSVAISGNFFLRFFVEFDQQKVTIPSRVLYHIRPPRRSYHTGRERGLYRHSVNIVSSYPKIVPVPRSLLIQKPQHAP